MTMFDDKEFAVFMNFKYLGRKTVQKSTETEQESTETAHKSVKTARGRAEPMPAPVGCPGNRVK